MIKVNIKVLIVVLIIILLVTIIILQFVAISKIKKKLVSDESKKQDILNLMMMNVMNNMNNTANNQSQNNAIANTKSISEQSCEVSPQTNFFAKSIDHAEKVLMGKVYLDGYKFGSSIDLTRLDDATKKSAIIAMKYMMIDPIGARNIESRFRAIAESENVPLWFVILHESIKKLIPKDDNLNVTQISNEALEAEVERRKLKEKDGGGKVVSINNVA